jgi:ABC-type multidrug transport system ATPase subunit
LNLAYRGSRLIISDFSLGVAAGEGVVVHGPAGIGKTTLARVITGKLRPDSGEISVDGKSLSASSATARAEILARWGVVSDDSTLLLDRSAGENVRTSIRISSHGGQVSDDDIDSAFRRFGLAARRSLNPSSLSSVEKFLLQLAMAWARSPLLFVLDDLDSALDSQSLTLAIDAIRERYLSGSAVLLLTSSPELYLPLSWRHVAIPMVR